MMVNFLTNYTIEISLYKNCIDNTQVYLKLSLVDINSVHLFKQILTILF